MLVLRCTSWNGGSGCQIGETHSCRRSSLGDRESLNSRHTNRRDDFLPVFWRRGHKTLILLFFSLRILLFRFIFGGNLGYWIDVHVSLNLKKRVFGADHDILLLHRRHELDIGEILFGNALKFSLIESHYLLNFIELLVNFVQTCFCDLRKSLHKLRVN